MSNLVSSFPAQFDESDHSVVVVYQNEHFEITSRPLCHGSIPSMAYRIDEADKRNVDTSKLRELGLRPGPWLAKIKDDSVEDSETVADGDGKFLSVGELRSKLLVTSAGNSLAYLTDFRLVPGTSEWEATVDWLRSVDTLICEAQYRESDDDLAEKNAHMTTKLVAELARAANVGELILQHISRRYEAIEWPEMQAEAQSVFANSKFPDQWSA